MKVIIKYVDEHIEEYKFTSKKAMQEFVDYYNELQTMQGGIKKMIIIY